MEGGKKQDAGAPANSSSSTSSSSPSGYFSSVFPSPSTVMAKDSSQSDLYWTFNKQRADGSIGNALGTATANLLSNAISIKMMKGMVRVTQTLPTEVNGGKV
ncbi:hypothetical protein B296_00038506 [Ensete ventricosum]|uniref:Uncharacterized protein n=1 Tax=Ensete ventricosum TaxID=4639 RepID=A0A426ZW50_ENSVE|nr:hypothetical protein B296_00038506 [Ensete ventricosum]